LGEVEAAIRRTAIDSAKVYLTAHARRRMAERGITLRQVLGCIRSGEFVEGPVLDSERQTGFKATLSAVSAGEKVQAVIKLIEAEDDWIVVITVIRA
jgi:hypothetical protein